MASLPSDLSRRELTLADKLRGIRWDLAALVTVIAGIGFAMLYSAANGSMHPWAARQMARYALAFVPMLAAALVDIPTGSACRTGFTGSRCCWSSRSMCA